MNMKVEPTISAQKNPGLPLRAAAVRLLGGVGGWGVGALRELAATTNKSLPRQQPRGPSAERARGGGWRACATASTSARRLRLQLSDRTAYAKAAPPKTRAPAAPKVNAPSAQTKHIRKHLETNRSRDGHVGTRQLCDHLPYSRAVCSTRLTGVVDTRSARCVLGVCDAVVMYIYYHLTRDTHG